MWAPSVRGAPILVLSQAYKGQVRDIKEVLGLGVGSGWGKYSLLHGAAAA